MTACTHCGAPDAPLHWRRPGSLASLPPDKRGFLHACGGACAEVIEARWRAICTAEGYSIAPCGPRGAHAAPVEPRDNPPGHGGTGGDVDPRQPALL